MPVDEVVGSVMMVLVLRLCVVGGGVTERNRFGGMIVVVGGDVIADEGGSQGGWR